MKEGENLFRAKLRKLGGILSPAPAAVCRACKFSPHRETQFRSYSTVRERKKY